jgi:hypothetical protein
MRRVTQHGRTRRLGTYRASRSASARPTTQRRSPARSPPLPCRACRTPRPRRPWPRCHERTPRARGRAWNALAVRFRSSTALSPPPPPPAARTAPAHPTNAPSKNARPTTAPPTTAPPTTAPPTTGPPPVAATPAPLDPRAQAKAQASLGNQHMMLAPAAARTDRRAAAHTLQRLPPRPPPHALPAHAPAPAPAPPSYSSCPSGERAPATAHSATSGLRVSKRPAGSELPAGAQAATARKPGARARERAPFRARSATRGRAGRYGAASTQSTRHSSAAPSSDGS